MNIKTLSYQINYYSLVALVFVLPLQRKLAPPFIILFLITSLINHRIKKKFISPPLKIIGLATLFFSYAIGCIYANDKVSAINDLVEKSSLLVFPLAFYCTKLHIKKHLTSILYAFVAGCLLSSVISLSVSIAAYTVSNNLDSFFYGNSSYFLHPSYWAMYLNFAILIIYFTKKNKKKEIIASFLIAFFSLIIWLSASKTGLFCWAITLLTILLHQVFFKKRYLIGSFASLSLVGLVGIVFQFSPPVQNRMNELFTVVASGNTASGSTTAARVEIWEASAQLIAEKPFFGYGTGNVQRVLQKSYQQKGLSQFAEKQLNAHNQFLQTGLAIGSVGVLVLLLMLCIPGIIALKNKHYLYLSFLVLIGFNFFTESMLERQAGVVFYALFNALLFCLHRSCLKSKFIT